MYKKTFSFKKQLEIGNKGENSFIKDYKELHPRKSNCREIDLIINDNDKIEIKSDSYPSKNFFMERYGNIKTKRAGGPWRAKNDHIKHFIYYFIKERTYFWFNPCVLCDFLDKNINKFEKRTVVNKGWASLGFLCPKEKIQELATRIDMF